MHLEYTVRGRVVRAGLLTVPLRPDVHLQAHGDDFDRCLGFLAYLSVVLIRYVWSGYFSGTL
jgi:hypothetical protein